jgi:hypothetical protein
MEGRGGGEAQGVAYPKKVYHKFQLPTSFAYLQIVFDEISLTRHSSSGLDVLGVAGHPSEDEPREAAKTTRQAHGLQTEDAMDSALKRKFLQ